MAGTDWQTVPKKLVPSKPNKHTSTKSFDIMKLFSNDGRIVPGGVTGRTAADIRRIIYNYVWSRDRRDESKNDFVVSEFGTDRNVMHYSHYYDQDGELRRKSHLLNHCNLMFANKQIAAEFLQFVYSVNTLEIDVDLKGQDTPEARAALGNIVARLEANPYYQKYTKAIRVRIHFPDNYPLHSLPAINQIVLEEICDFINGCQSVSMLGFHAIMMEGLNDYELRYVAFPFYPLKFTDWNISVLNMQTYRFDRVQREELHYLNLAWDHYVEHGSLTGKIPRGQHKNSPVPTRPGSPELADPQNTTLQQGTMKDATNGPVSSKHNTKNKNGSKKKKGRKSGGQATPPQSAAPSVTGDDVAHHRASPPSPPSTPTPLTPATPTNCSTSTPDAEKHDGYHPDSAAREDHESNKLDTAKDGTTTLASKKEGSEEHAVRESPGLEQLSAMACRSESHKDPSMPLEMPSSPAQSSSSSTTFGRDVLNEEDSHQESTDACKDDNVAGDISDEGMSQATDQNGQEPKKDKKSVEHKRQQRKRSRKRKNKAEIKAMAEAHANEVTHRVQFPLRLVNLDPSVHTKRTDIDAVLRVIQQARNRELQERPVARAEQRRRQLTN